MTKARPSGRRIAVISLLAILVAAPAVLMGPLRSSSDSSADAASYAEAGPQIRRLYLAYFHREPDSEGWRTWLEYRRQGQSLEWVSDRFAESEEFRLRYGTLTNDDFVRLVYRQVLDREPDPTGWEYWRGFLNSGRSRGWVMMGFSESLEFQWRTKPATTGPASQPLPAEPAPSNPAPSNPAPSNPAPAPSTPAIPSPSVSGVPSIPSNFDVSRYLTSRSIPESTANEPSGNFRTLCAPSHFAYDDPIVYPGQANRSHLHMFFGNDAVNANTDYQSLRTTGGSTCEGGPLNRTGYWVPAMFDGANQVVPARFILVYYKATASGGSLASQQATVRSVAPLPNGLRMIAGSPGGHASWMCEDGSNEGSTIPNGCPQGQGVIGTVGFPNCWDGKNLDSADHRSHMAYKSYVNGVHTCPSSHPVQIAEITEKFYYPWSADIGSWYLSSDRAGMITPAPDGSTLHADWFGGWDTDVMLRWHNNCLVGMRNSNNGGLCDGQALSGFREWSGPARLTGYTPAR